ncbi:MAG: hypothetical protein ACRDCE_06155 [Cetobacterium sp.]|uniref:hypothetical protein n=1 Tax=Cetobacterium sp. TaxID=2071632 RepID=UPI003EE6B1EE
MVFNWNLGEHHKLCMDEGLTVRSYGNCEYAMIKDEENNYSLFEVSLDAYNDTNEEAWTRIASNKDFDKFKIKLANLFMKEEEVEAPNLEKTFRKPNLYAKDKKEVKVVRTLKNLIGLENGVGLHLNYNNSSNQIQIYTETELKMETIDLDFLKAMGFKFEYKPLRNEEEILKDLVEKEFDFHGGNYTIGKGFNGAYAIIGQEDFKTDNTKYYTKISIAKVVKELNELWESRL